MENLREVAGPLAVLCGALIGVGLLAVVLGFRKKERTSTFGKINRRHIQGTGKEVLKKRADDGAKILLAIGGGVAGWLFTGWPVAALLGLVGGWVGPEMVRAPKRRQHAIDEIEAYSQWTEQLRDLVGASGSLFEAVALSASNAPESLRPAVTEMATIARATGLPQALTWFADEMNSVYADRLVLGMRIAWDSGARLTEAFDATAHAMRAEVEVRRRNEVANSRAWTQVTAILGVTGVSVLVMFVFNKGFFEPFGTGMGQLILLAVGIMIFGNVFWVLKLSQAQVPVRLLTPSGNEHHTRIPQPTKPTKPTKSAKPTRSAKPTKAGKGASS